MRFSITAIAVMVAFALSSTASAVPVPVIYGHSEKMLELGPLPPEASRQVAPEAGGPVEVAFVYSRFHIYGGDVWTWNGRHVLHSGDKFWEVPPDAWQQLISAEPSAKYGTPFRYRFPLIPSLLALVVAARVAAKRFIRSGTFCTRCRARCVVLRDGLWAAMPSDLHDFRRRLMARDYSCLAPASLDFSHGEQQVVLLTFEVCPHCAQTVTLSALRLWLRLNLKGEIEQADSQRLLRRVSITADCLRTIQTALVTPEPPSQPDPVAGQPGPPMKPARFGNRP